MVRSVSIVCVKLHLRDERNERIDGRTDRQKREIEFGAF